MGVWGREEVWDGGEALERRRKIFSKVRNFHTVLANSVPKNVLLSISGLGRTYIG